MTQEQTLQELLHSACNFPGMFTSSDSTQRGFPGKWATFSVQPMSVLLFSDCTMAQPVLCANQNIITERIFHVMNDITSFRKILKF